MAVVLVRGAGANPGLVDFFLLAETSVKEENLNYNTHLIAQTVEPLCGYLRQN